MVPFRNSKLTFLLKDSLSGNSITFMLATISPAKDNIEETLSTLRFASSVKKIQTVAVRNLSEKDKIILQLREEVQKLKDEVAARDDGHSLEKEIAAQEKMCDHFEKDYHSHLQAQAELNSARDGALQGLGLSNAEETDLSETQDTPYLLNLSDDPMLSGYLIYVLMRNSTISVGSDPQSMIVLRGLGIPPQLCSFKNEENTNVFLEIEMSRDVNRRVLVNGRAVLPGRPTLLQSADQILFGRACAMQLHVPLQAKLREHPERAELKECLLDTQLDASDSYKELVTAMNGPASLAIEMQWHLVEVCHLVDEANEITREVRKSDGLRLQVALLGDVWHEVPENSIVIRVLRFDDSGKGTLLYFWTMTKLRERIEMMRDAYHSFHNKGSWEGKDTIEDPWIELDMEHRVHLSLHGLEQSKDFLSKKNDLDVPLHKLIESHHLPLHEDEDADSTQSLPGSDTFVDRDSTFADSQDFVPHLATAASLDGSSLDGYGEELSTSHMFVSAEENHIDGSSPASSTPTMMMRVVHNATKHAVGIQENAQHAGRVDHKTTPSVRAFRSEKSMAVISDCVAQAVRGITDKALLNITEKNLVAQIAAEKSKVAVSDCARQAVRLISEKVLLAAFAPSSSPTDSGKRQRSLERAASDQAMASPVQRHNQDTGVQHGYVSPGLRLVQEHKRDRSGALPTDDVKQAPRKGKQIASSAKKRTSSTNDVHEKSRDRPGSPKAQPRKRVSNSKDDGSNLKDSQSLEDIPPISSSQKRKNVVTPRSPRLSNIESRLEARLASTRTPRNQKLEVVWHGSVRLRKSPKLDDKADEVVHTRDVLTGVETQMVGTTLWWRLDDDLWIPMTTPDKAAIVRHTH